MTLHRTACPLDCPDACGVLVERDPLERFVRLRGDPDHPHNQGSLCGKTAIFGELQESPERLLVPRVRRPGGGFEDVSWDRAVDTIVERVRPLGGERILALCYAGCMGLVNRHFPMRLMHALGATETDGGICDNTSTAGYECVLGHVVGADLALIPESDAFVLWGADARRTHPHLMPRLRELCRRGRPVFVIDIWRTDTIRAVERWGGRGLVIRPGSDAALALALVRMAYEKGRADLEFLERECVGADDLRRHVAGPEYGLGAAAEATGLEPNEILALGEALFGASRPFVKTGIGFTRRRQGAMSMRAVCSLAAVLGIVDRLHYESFAHFGLDTDVIPRPDLRAPAERRPPIRHVETGAELASGRFGAVFVWGHNPAATLPDSSRVREGLSREDVFVVVHELFHTETAELADVVLPATTFLEQSDVYRSYNHRSLQYGRRVVAPPGETKSNVACFGALSRAFGLSPELWDVSEDVLCRELLEASRARFRPGELERLLAGERVDLGPRRFPDRGTPSGRIELVSEAAARAGEPAIATYLPDDGAGGSGAFGLVAAPSVWTHNTTYAHSTRHVRRAGAPRCLLHPDAAAALGVTEGEAVELTSEQGGLVLPVAFSEDVPPALVRVDGFPDPRRIPGGLGINVLVPGAQSALAGGNVLYSTRVDVRRAAPRGRC